ncbi:hypothetical protein Tco_0900847 [Tanacetum coccineum]
MAAKFHNRSINSVLSKIVLGAVVYYIWQERNKRQFTNERRNVDDLSKIILDTVRLKLSSIKVIKTVFVEFVETEWGNSDGWYLDGSMNFKGNWMNNQMRDRLGNVVIELWSGAKWVFALG